MDNLLTDNVFCTILTVIAILFNVTSIGRSIIYATKLEYNQDWVCSTNNIDGVIKLLLGGSIVCGIYVSLRTWIIIDIYLDDAIWHHMTVGYQFRAYAAVAANLGLGMYNWNVTTFMKNMKHCDTSNKYKELLHKADQQSCKHCDLTK